MRNAKVNMVGKVLMGKGGRTTMKWTEKGERRVAVKTATCRNTARGIRRGMTERPNAKENPQWRSLICRRYEQSGLEVVGGISSTIGLHRVGGGNIVEERQPSGRLTTEPQNQRWFEYTEQELVSHVTHNAAKWDKQTTVVGPTYN